MRVLVCGGRTYGNSDHLFAVLDRLHAEHHFDFVLEGGATGADSLARDWAQSRGINGREFHANWGKFGKSAGPIRNQRMLDVGKPDLVVAFPGNDGTEDMVSRAAWAHVPVIEIREE